MSRRLPEGAEEGACQLCGKRVFVVWHDGQRVQLDVTAPVFQLQILRDSVSPELPVPVAWLRANRGAEIEPAFVEHRSVCQHERANPKRSL